MKKAVVVFSGGIDSVCSASMLKSRYELYGISFSYGQKADKEIQAARMFARKLNLKEHKIVDVKFMKELYGDSNALTSKRKKIPDTFEYSIVVPIRNAVFLSISSAWAYALGARVVAYGAHTGDKNYPDCRPAFANRLASAFNLGEYDGIKTGQRESLEIWSPYMKGLSKADLLKKGYKAVGESIFKAWSCYTSKERHCGICESCKNRRAAFEKAKIPDKTKYLK